MEFREMVKQSTREGALNQLRTTVSLVEASIATFKDSKNTDGRALYGALSRLATVDDLHLSMAQYDNLMFIDGALLDPSVLQTAESKLRELKHIILIQTLQYGSDAGWNTKFSGTESGVVLNDK